MRNSDTKESIPSTEIKKGVIKNLVLPEADLLTQESFGVNESCDIGQLIQRITSPAAIYYFDNAKSKFIVRHLNEAALHLFDLDSHKSIGRPVERIISLYKDEKLLQNLKYTYSSRLPVQNPVNKISIREKDSYVESSISSLPSGFVLELFTDLTEKSISEDDLINHASFVMNSPDPTFRVRLNGDLIAFNPAALKLYKKDLTGLSVLELIPGLTLDLLNSISGNLPFQLEGEIGDETFLFSIVKDADSETLYIYTSNITKLKETQAIQKVLFEIANAVHETDHFNHLFRIIQRIVGKVMDTRNFFIVLYDKETDTLSLPYFVDEKDSFQSIPPGKTLSSYVIKNNVSLLLTESDFLKMVDEGKIELVGSLSKKWLGVPMMSNDEVIGAVIVQSYEDENAYDEKDLKILHFISEQIALSIERKRSDDLRKESEELYRSVIEHTSDAIFVVQSEKIVLVNPAWEELTGYSLSEAGTEGFNFFNLIVQDKREEVINALSLQRRTRSGQFFYDIDIVTRKGTVVNLEVNISKIQYKGKTAYQGICRDITEYKKSIDKINQYNQELKILNTNKDKFFSLIAHDLKSPFNALLGYSDFMINDFADLNRGELREGLQHINKASQNIYSLLENLLQWSGLQTGGISFQPQRFLLYNLGKKVIELYSKNAEAKDIKLTLLIDKFSEVFADENMVYTILRNLISNAIKFSNFGGEISINSETFEKFVKISVSDNGIGISDEDYHQLFRMDRNHSTLGTNKERGTGLGLLLCKELIAKNNGKLEVITKPGKGSTFSFELPAYVD